MKNKLSVTIILLTIMIMSLTGCSKYEEDNSYTTDLYGSYSEYVEASNASYSRNENYTFNSDNTYNHIYKEIIDRTTNNDSDTSGKILSVEEISNDITKITLDEEVTNWSTDETSNQTIYKYRNILGSFYEIEVPKGKTFELHLNDYAWLDEGGQYHLCNGDNCECDTSSPKYVRKDNIIYFKSMDKNHKDSYKIGMYIVEDGIFIPQLYKED